MELLGQVIKRVWLAGIITLATIYYLIETLLLPRGVKESLLLVGPMSLIVFGCFISIFLKELKEMRSIKSKSNKDGSSILKSNEMRKVIFAVLLIIFLVTTMYIGFDIATLILLPVMLYFLGVRKVKFIIMYTIIYSFVVIGVFVTLLNIRLPMLFL